MINSQDANLDSYVIGNTSRPILSHGSKGTKVNRRSYLYVEALRKIEKEV